MAKLPFLSLFCFLLLAACGVKDTEQALIAPLSISGKIDCPQRQLTTLTPNEYTITLYDSLNTVLKTTQPNTNGKYVFEDLEEGKTYAIRVTRKTLNPPTLSANQVKNYIQQTPRPNQSDLALVAADVDKNGEIDETDALHVDRLIQGVTSNLPGGGWRIFPSFMIGQNNNFNNAASPLRNLRVSINNYDFIVVTLGDMTLTRCN